MREFSDRVGVGIGSIGDLAPLAIVPVVLSLLDVDAIRNVLAYDGLHVGLKFGIPVPAVDLWSVVDPPDAGAAGGSNYHWEAGTTDLLAVADGAAAADALAFAVGSALVGLLIEAVLVAGYLGGIREYLATGRYGFAANVRRYAVSLVALYLLGFAAFLAALPALLAVPPLIVPGVLGFSVVIYLLWATPYLLVVRDCSLPEALVGSYRLAAAGGPHFRFTLTYLATILVLSVPASLVVANGGAIGLFVGLVGVGPVGLALNVAVVDFVMELSAERDDLLPDSTTLRDESVRGTGEFRP